MICTLVCVEIIVVAKEIIAHHVKQARQAVESGEHTTKPCLYHVQKHKYSPSFRLREKPILHNKPYNHRHHIEHNDYNGCNSHMPSSILVAVLVNFLLIFKLPKTVQGMNGAKKPVNGKEKTVPIVVFLKPIQRTIPSDLICRQRWKLLQLFILWETSN